MSDNSSHRRRRFFGVGTVLFVLALAQYQRALVDLVDADVKAPIDGIVTNTVLAPGQFASADFSTPDRPPACVPVDAAIADGDSAPGLGAEAE